MIVKAIELQLLQLEGVFSKSKGNIYSDKKKEKYFEDLYLLFDAIKKADIEKYDYNLQGIHYQILNYIFGALEFLDNSTLNLIPFETVFCLEKVLDEWISDDNFIIATSLSNRNLDFYFMGENVEFFKLMNDTIEKLYGLKISKRLIKIVLPRVLSRDYLSIVVLYHELGHFIDIELNISQNIFFKKFGFKSSYSNTEIQEHHHTMEYFADVFASQYINDASNLFLNYISAGTLDSTTHPATKKRVEFVDKFLNGEKIGLIDEFNLVLAAQSKQQIEIRHSVFDADSSDFNEFIPQQINSENELHSVFKLGWDFWNNSETNTLNKVPKKQRYNIINNLVEKSISNYIVVSKWQNL
ncbi:hypothetical protein NAL32_15515 [Chryseobacterium sp. Ch-15]|uniref:Uncharacterized protein n=1 Tax=Chryseobacterium muglaense TaxID=2893752 RepID=A0A9Q3YSE6_9FLAO|nr:hypothetical protein [Chryseobacterium muglaense]MBD3905993.1 hypothetical protein [Chryseobacterium muglaense]MCC9035273.1 hypothetical protein [Chryseobacterium muglaense]MCM2555792.1 hypothetical protein [Chryseobacterium muglaense]